MNIGDLFKLKRRFKGYGIVEISADEENLVIYTCYPLSTLGLTSKRYFVYAEYVSGPVIIINE